MSWFNQGYNKVEERDKEIQEATNFGLPNLIIKENDPVDVYISFITGEPLTYYHHFVRAKKRYYTCPDNGDASKGNCPLCAMGNKATFQGAYLVIDHRHEQYQDKNGNQVNRQHTLKVAKFGIRVLKSLKKQDEKLKKGSPGMAPVPNGLLGVPFSVIRSGSGTDTQYTFGVMNPDPNYFPRTYQLEPGKTEIDMIVDSIKPLTKEQLLGVINGAPAQPQQQYGQPAFNGGQQASYGQPAPYGQPAQYGQVPQGAPTFNQAPQGPPSFNQAPQGAPQGVPQGPPTFNQAPQNQPQNPPQGGGVFGAFTQNPTPPEDDADVIDFNS